MIRKARSIPPARAVSIPTAWRDRLVRSAEQALEDLAVAEASEVVFVRADDAALEQAYVDALEDRALAGGFVAAQITIALDRSFESLDAVVRGVLEALTIPAPKGERHRGIFELLDAFAAKHGRHALAHFDRNAETIGAAGDLISLARGYVASAGEPRAEKRRLAAWVEGTQLARSEERPLAALALTVRTAKRALTELSRLVRVLDHRGLLIFFRNADALLHLPPGRRESAYTVLRELVDNADGGNGATATRFVVMGTTALFEGTRSLASLRPLVGRVAILPGSHLLPPPHRPLIDLSAPIGFDPSLDPPEPSFPDPAQAQALRTIIRACHGLPPIESILSMSVGQEAIDRTIDHLFEHSAMDGSVFALLTGDYGTGKTHLLLHLSARALADRRPVMRLSLERLDADLGNPQRHLRRLLEGAMLPGTGRVTFIDRLMVWTHVPEALDKLYGVLEELSVGKGEVAGVAQRALRRAANPKTRGIALETFLGATDLLDKGGGANYRRDAYGRLLLWSELLERIEGCAGPVVIIDEAENLYKIGISRSERRTALRSLSFYCGGVLPRACVVMAITPDVLDVLREEAKELLDEVSEQTTLLSLEDAAMLRRRLVRLKPIKVPALTQEHQSALLERVRATHARVRRPVSKSEWARFADALLAEPELTPREIVRRATDWLESAWWNRS